MKKYVGIMAFVVLAASLVLAVGNSKKFWLFSTGQQVTSPGDYPVVKMHPDHEMYLVVDDELEAETLDMIGLKPKSEWSMLMDTEEEEWGELPPDPTNEPPDFNRLMEPGVYFYGVGCPIGLIHTNFSSNSLPIEWSITCNSNLTHTLTNWLDCVKVCPGDMVYANWGTNCQWHPWHEIGSYFALGGTNGTNIILDSEYDFYLRRGYHAGRWWIPYPKFTWNENGNITFGGMSPPPDTNFSEGCHDWCCDVVWERTNGNPNPITAQGTIYYQGPPIVIFPHDATPEQRRVCASNFWMQYYACWALGSNGYHYNETNWYTAPTNIPPEILYTPPFKLPPIRPSAPPPKKIKGWKTCIWCMTTYLKNGKHRCPVGGGDFWRPPFRIHSTPLLDNEQCLSPITNEIFHGPPYYAVVVAYSNCTDLANSYMGSATQRCDDFGDAIFNTIVSNDSGQMFYRSWYLTNTP